MIEDRWINFVLLNGWRLKAEVNEETGELTILVSNEKGNVNLGGNFEFEESIETHDICDITGHGGSCGV